MKIIIILFIHAMFIFYGETLFAQSNDIKINLKGPVNKINDLNGFCFSVQIIMGKGFSKKIALQHCLQWAYSVNEYNLNEHNGIWIIEKFQNNIYSSIGIRTQVNEHPGKCYDLLGNELFDTISVNSPLSFNKSVAAFYEFKPGNYRAKLKILLPKGTCNNDIELYSNWKYFKVKNY